MGQFSIREEILRLSSVKERFLRRDSASLRMDFFRFSETGESLITSGFLAKIKVFPKKHDRKLSQEATHYMISDRNQFCLRLKQARQEAKLKQEVVARYLQIPTSAVSSFESGSRKLDAFELFMLAKLYQKPMEWFFSERPDY